MTLESESPPQPTSCCSVSNAVTAGRRTSSAGAVQASADCHGVFLPEPYRTFVAEFIHGRARAAGGRPGVGDGGAAVMHSPHPTGSVIETVLLTRSDWGGQPSRSANRVVVQDPSQTKVKRVLSGLLRSPFTAI